MTSLLDTDHMGLRITAIALAQDVVVVVTRHTRDFGRVPGLEIED